MRAPVGFILALSACGRAHSPSCDSTTRTIADDELLPDLDFSVADLFADVAGERVVPAQILGEGREVVEVAAVAVTAGRGEGDAEWTDSVPVDNVTPFFGIGDRYVDIYVRCDGGLSVPATLAVARGDEAGALSAEGELNARPEDLAVESVQVSGGVTSTEGEWTSMVSAYAGYAEGQLVGLQLQSGRDIVVDWR